jgi:hypothetical protein
MLCRMISWELSHLSRVAESWNSLPHFLQTYQPLKLGKCYHLKKLFYHTSITLDYYGTVPLLTYDKKRNVKSRKQDGSTKNLDLNFGKFLGFSVPYVRIFSTNRSLNI